MKKRLLGLVTLIAAGITGGYIFILSWLAGFVACKWGGGKSEGQPGRVKSIIIPFGKWKLHLHHWLCSVGLIGISTTSGFHLVSPPVTYGFLGGLVFQGIYCYKDWYRIIINRTHTKPRMPLVKAPKKLRHFHPAYSSPLAVRHIELVRLHI